jgi:hypothetical protein
MKEKIKALIAEKILEQGRINIVIKNLGVMDMLDNDTLDQYLQDKENLENDIIKLKEILKTL